MLKVIDFWKLINHNLGEGNLYFCDHKVNSNIKIASTLPNLPFPPSNATLISVFLRLQLPLAVTGSKRDMGKSTLRCYSFPLPLHLFLQVYHPWLLII